MPEGEKRIRIDAKTFQLPLTALAETMVEKVFREGDVHLAGPRYVTEDMAAILRYSESIYHLLYYLNADERRKSDVDWKVRYGVTGMSLVRSLIDCLYNVMAILEDPAVKGAAYHKSGLNRTLKDLDEDHQAYRGQPEWETWIEQRSKAVESYIRLSGLKLEEVQAEPMWPTLGRYLGKKQPDGTLTDNQQFLKTFTLLEWRQYSALSHAAAEAFIGTLGHIPLGAYYMSDFLPHDERNKLDDTYDIFVSTHLGCTYSALHYYGTAGALPFPRGQHK